MRILLDEDLPVRLRHLVPGEHEVETVQYRGWKGLENGELLKVASGEFDALLTKDDRLPDQQNLRGYDIAVVVLRPRSQAFVHFVELMPEVAERLSSLRTGRAIRIHPPRG